MPVKEARQSEAGKYICYIEGVFVPGGVGFSFDEHSPVYIDGSVLCPNWPELACGAAAAVQITTLANGSLVFRVAFIPMDSSYPQESAAAEHLAAQMAIELGADGALITLVTDCASVVSGYQAARGRLVNHKGVYAGVWLNLDIGKVKENRTAL